MKVKIVFISYIPQRIWERGIRKKGKEEERRREENERGRRKKAKPNERDNVEEF